MHAGSEVTQVHHSCEDMLHRDWQVSPRLTSETKGEQGRLMLSLQLLIYDW